MEPVGVAVAWLVQDKDLLKASRVAAFDAYFCFKDIRDFSLWISGEADSGLFEAVSAWFVNKLSILELGPKGRPTYHMTAWCFADLGEAKDGNGFP